NSSTNHGTLIQPAQPLDEFMMSSLDGGTWKHEQFTGKWTLLYIGDESCDLYCEANLFKMRQVRLALGRDRQRIQLKYLGLYTQQSKQAIENIFSKYPGMEVAWFDKPVALKALPQFKDLPIHQIYVIDTLGNLMMWYPKDATSRGIKKDLKRLLKVSKIG
ncbi:MAG: hypothetical protein P8X88_09530, partial [Gammaproteobacteria bacterium]